MGALGEPPGQQRTARLGPRHPVARLREKHSKGSQETRSCPLAGVPVSRGRQLPGHCPQRSCPRRRRLSGRGTGNNGAVITQCYSAPRGFYAK